jgi:hypothetical protein
MSKNELVAERDALQRKLDWLGVRSTGSDRIENRIREINRLLGYSQERYLRRVAGRVIALEYSNG